MSQQKFEPPERVYVLFIYNETAGTWFMDSAFKSKDIAETCVYAKRLRGIRDMKIVEYKVAGNEDQVSAIENMLQYLRDELYVTRRRRAEYPVNLFEKFYPSPEQLIERFIMLAEFQVKRQKTRESLTEEERQG